MRESFAPALRAGRAVVFGSLVLGGAASVQAQVQVQTQTVETKSPQKDADALLAIDDDYNQKLQKLEHERLQRLQRLAAERQPKEAAVVYEQLFRLAIAGDLYQEAEPAADAVIASADSSAACQVLARLVKLIAECDRGDYDQSLIDLRAVLAKHDKAVQEGARTVHLTSDEVIEICEAYYQRLIQAGRFDIARKAFQLALENADQPEVKEFLSSRLTRLKLVGEPALPIKGLDLDGKPYSLADAKGKVVLVVFWASWCLPNAVESEWLQQVYSAHHAQGLEIVGVNLDLMQGDSPKLESLLPNIRRFALDYNLRWPNLINNPADGDIAKAYGVTQIPANVLIGRDGKVAAIDLAKKNLGPAIEKLVGH